MASFMDHPPRMATPPEKGARVVARSFYRELRRAGYAEREIMAIADELLGCLVVSLRECRPKKEPSSA